MRTSPWMGAVTGLLMLGGVGCSSVGSSAIRTDGVNSGRHVGAVRVYAIMPPEGAKVIGVIEVHALNEEANVETLMPVFMRRVADIGGTGAVVDGLHTHYEMRTEYRQESYSYPCGHKQTCWNTRMVPYQYQVRILSIQGRAIVPSNAPAPAPAPVPSAAPTAAPAPGHIQGEQL